MPSVNIDKNVICPCYKGGGSLKVRCEGVVDGCSTHLVFSTGKQKKEHMEYRCKSMWGYLKCHVYKAVAKRWGAE